MALDLSAVGRTSEPYERSWESKDALLYAVAVGAGSPDVRQELSFTTENTRDVDQQALPTFGVIIGAGGGGLLRNIGSFNRAMLVHAEQGIELHKPIAPQGRLQLTTTLTEILDKGSGALVRTETHGVEAESGDAVLTTRSGMFIRGEGGFAATTSSEATAVPTPPRRDPDHVVTYETLPQQALIYRLCGDRNPLHSDPGFAARGGFDRPILHGLCTFGFTGRALLHTLCGSDPARFRSMAGRFSRPVMPGDTLTVGVWHNEREGAATFTTTTSDGAVVIDRGRCTFS